MSKAHCTRFRVQVIPNARQSEIVGTVEGAVRIRLQAPPVDGKANEALVRFLADVLGLRKSALAIFAGHTARRKTIEVSGCEITDEQLIAALLASGRARTSAPED